MDESTADVPGIGDTFPDLTVETSMGERSLPDDYEGKWLVLFSHPGDFTPVCTSEFVAFEQRREEFEELNAELLGLSVDRVHSHIKWTEWIAENLDVDIQFPIIADDQGTVAQQLGMLHPGAGTATVRTVFVIDPEGAVRLRLTYPMEIGRNIDEVLRSLRALQKSDDDGVAAPADWPNNDKFGDQVLLSPPGTEADAEARKAEAADDDELNYYDWWFVTRDQ
ncbi:peroxiredoxin (alkyl hydroperoxide reductase subunit C) [Natrinema hispanicum]|uniref:Peroxiredoxin n=2 Tax=Natrinema hispanicum TaxID=392421 RepID=A0A1G6VEN6_9EURY|nr:peroxiredoxin (alkyl hydroperoxide reductase subunit C) [Natrinema hispanicum]SEU15364.1 peroxiredoxin (alkyl hydroperoxide reductase subunit C) [Natrinema hispanicum]